MKASDKVQVAQEAKTWEKQAAKDCRAAKEAEQQAQQAARDPNTLFQGSLSSKWTQWWRVT